MGNLKGNTGRRHLAKKIQRIYGTKVTPKPVEDGKAKAKGKSKGKGSK